MPDYTVPNDLQCAYILELLLEEIKTIKIYETFEFVYHF